MSVPTAKATGWDRVSFLDVCDIQGGTQPPKDEWISKAREGYVRMLQIRDFTQPDRPKVEYVKDSSKLKKCEDEDILIGRYGASVGKILNGLSGAYNVAIAKCIFDHQKIERDYLLFWLRSSHFQNAVQNFGGRAAQAGFNKTDLGELHIPLPPLAEQKRIAEILDAADALRTKRRESLAQLDTLLQSTFLDMFGDPVTNPMGLPKETLKSAFEFNTGKLDSNAAVEGGKYPFFTCARETFAIDDYAFDCEALLLAGNNANADYSVKHYKGKFNAYQRTYVITVDENLLTDVLPNLSSFISKACSGYGPVWTGLQTHSA